MGSYYSTLPQPRRFVFPEESAMHDFENDNGCTVTYDCVRKSRGGKPFTMSLTDTEEIQAVIQAVNQGIDAHLEACFCPERGDRYESGERKASKLQILIERSKLPEASSVPSGLYATHITRTG
jgi:hypothetical protein